MIYLNLNIRNPWSDQFENVKNWAGQVTENKWWEVEILKTENLFRFEFQYTIRQDHAGLGLEVGLFGWEFHANIHDSRHWDYEKNCYYNYNEKGDWK
jgi:hypothetical protein